MLDGNALICFCDTFIVSGIEYKNADRSGSTRQQKEQPITDRQPPPQAQTPLNAAPSDGGSSAMPIAWGLLLIPAIAQLLLHLLTNGRYGIFRDEYYYIACAARPAWGYVDQPPFSIWLLAGWKSIFGDSVHSIRILPALCGSALIVLTGATAAQLGGGRWAQLFAGLAAAIGAAGLVICGFYSMNCYDFLFWLGGYYLLIRIARTSDGKWWPWLGVVLGLGLFNKIGLLVFGLALLIGLLATTHRHFFTDRRLYFAGAIAAVFVLPYVLWNFANDWAALEFIENAKGGKITHFSPLEFLSENILEANPVTLSLWVGGLVWLLLAKKARRYRLVAMMFITTYVILILQKSKPYYFAASFPVLMAAGGVAWERWTNGHRWRWARWVMLANLLAGGVLLAPIAVPLLSPEKTVAYGQKMGIIPAPQEVSHTSALPQYFSDRFGWENLARVVSEVYQGLPANERDRCIVLGRNYGHAGSLEYWSRRYDLPPVYSVHNNYWLWGPPPESNDVMIVIGNRRELLEELFDEVIEAAVAKSPHAMESHLTIWICRGLRRPVGEIWKDFKSYG
jgi:4-amino-4-deoxy-L-arabinose transferase-like glycosyltransferase